MTRQQFNVTLDPDLVRRIKHHSIDAQLSLSDLTARLFETHLTAGARVPDQPNHLTLQPLVHVTDMPAAVAFYEALGAGLVNGSRDGDFVLLSLGGAQIGLLAHPPNPEQGEGDVELGFAAGSAEELDRVEQRLRSAGADIVQPASDEGFGRQLQVRSPDGLLVKVNQLEPELYG